MGLSKSNKGQLAEYRVAILCLSLGFEVYKSLTVNGAVVTPDSILFKVKNRRIQKLFPGSILARPPKRH